LTQSGLSMSMAAGVVVEKESEFILSHSGLRALDGLTGGAAWVGVFPW